MLDRQALAFRRAQALIAASRDLYALTALAVRHSHAAIVTTAPLLAEPPPNPFLASTLRRPHP